MSLLTNNSIDLDATAASFVKALPKLDSFGQRLSLELYRLLAAGQPVQQTLLADRLGVAVETVKKTLGDWPGVFFDSRRQVVGYWGLSLPAAYDSPHKITIDGRKLSAWCAWDTLFLPELLGQTADVESMSPASGATVRLTVTPEGIEHLSPVGAQMSFLLPEAASIQKDILSAFCCFVHFFPSYAVGESWVAQHDGAFLLSMEEGFAVAHRKNTIQYPGISG